MARTRAAKPAAELARPAAVGKLFSETTLRFHCEIFVNLGSAASISDRRERREAMQARVRGDLDMSWDEPLRMRRSEWAK